MRVGVIDYGVGNLGSVVRSLEEVGACPILISDTKSLGQADRILLPGVGAFADCANALVAGGWYEALYSAVIQDGRLLLGICVGMQLLAEGSTEGATDGEIIAGLGFIEGQVQNIGKLGVSGRVPHVGWNSVASTTSGCEMFNGIPNGTDFYFVHSYAFAATNPEHVAAHVTYGANLTAAVRKENIWGTQFHPEKSSRAGFRLLRNFIEAPE